MNKNTQPNNLIGTQTQRFYFAVSVVFILTILAVILFRGSNQRLMGPSTLEWVISYVLIGVITGLIFYIVDPLRTQEFQWKGIVNIAGAAAIGLSFMFLASQLAPPAPKLTLDNLLNSFEEKVKPLRNELNNKFVAPITVEVSSTPLVINISNYPLRERNNIEQTIQNILSDKNLNELLTPRIVFHPPSFHVILMDSVEDKLIYNPQKGSNAAILNPLLRDLKELELNTETTSPGWDLHEQVLKSNPDLIIIHASCFSTHTRQPKYLQQLDKEPFNAFLKYMASTKTKFLIYSRALYFENEEEEAKDFEKLDSRLKGRVTFFHAQDSFKNMAELTRFKLTVKDILSLP